MPTNRRGENEPGQNGSSLATVGSNTASSQIAMLGGREASTAPSQDLERLDRLASLGTLSAGLAHEIRNALVGVTTFIDLLLEKNQDAHLAGIVRRELHRVDAMAGQMLNLASPYRPNFAAVHLHEIIERALCLVQHQINTKPIALTQSYDAASDLVHGDELQLEQAFLNLFLNALESMGPNGQLHIATEHLPPKGSVNGSGQAPASRRLRVLIKDSGTGISPENMERLFEPFFTTKRGGTGLGLAITKRIIRQHGGTIEAQSSPSQGSTFTILFPGFDEASSAGAPARAE